MKLRIPHVSKISGLEIEIDLSKPSTVQCFVIPFVILASSSLFRIVPGGCV